MGDERIQQFSRDLMDWWRGIVEKWNALLEELREALRIWTRIVTDRRVHCEHCGQFIGYVWRGGIRRWLCPNCSSTGMFEHIVEPRAP